MAKVKITVLKRDLYKDIVEKYGANKDTKACEMFTEGQEFTLDSSDVPKGFCSWAWADIHRDIIAISKGASFDGWIKNEGTQISCCTDGLRPVTFKIERVV